MHDMYVVYVFVIDGGNFNAPWQFKTTTNFMFICSFQLIDNRESNMFTDELGLNVVAQLLNRLF
jgi:hypothetical protein